jgi:uncharacterized membrane protein
MTKPVRLPAIDMLRGFVIALMALDHTRDFFGYTRFNVEDLAATEPAWFWTRLITHLCAPIFVLLARGALLILIEATWISFSWQFGYNVIIFQVLWALGAGMMVLSLLVWLPRPAIAVIAALLILPHNLLDNWEPGGLLWQLWHKGGFYPFAEGFGLQGLVVAYPIMPWVGLMAAGYALAPVFQWQHPQRERFLLIAGGALLLAFVALRAFNTYGDPDPWSPQGRGFMFDLMSFMRVHKYPPSVLYLFVTVGIGLLLLVLFERLRPNRVLMLFGRTPMFFYVIHIALIHLLGNIYFDLRYGGGPEFANDAVTWPDGYQHSLPVVYLAWIGILALMYALTIAWTRRRATAVALQVPSTPEQSAG